MEVFIPRQARDETKRQDTKHTLTVFGIIIVVPYVLYNDTCLRGGQIGPEHAHQVR